MKKNIVLFKIDKLKLHEDISLRHSDKLTKRIKRDGYIKNPIIVDSQSLVVLDGHHRLHSLRALGCNKIPVFLVNYRSKDIRAYLRIKKLRMDLIKDEVIRRGNTKKLFPYKTTRHFLKNRPRGVNIDLEKLK